MLQKTLSRLGTVFVVGVALYGTTAAAQVKQSAAGQLPACTATVSGDSVKVAATPIVLQAVVSAELGDSISASFPKESKINVVKVAPAANKDAKGVEVTINTSEAQPGDWPISLKGKSGECTGQVKITGK